MKCPKKNNSGSSVIEFVLVLPWLIACFLAIITVAIWVMTGQLMQYSAYKGARAVSVYEQEGAKMEIQDAVPNANILGLDQKEFYIEHPIQKLLKPIVTHAPVYFALDGVSLDLSTQSKQDEKFRLPFMDNWIGYCGGQGDYSLCDR